MKRIAITPRNFWQNKVETLGFGFHSLEGIKYWDESAYYQFTYPQVEQLEKATNTLHEMCLEAVQYVMDHNLYHLFHIPASVIPLIERSWENDEPSLYGRFDLAYDGIHPPKMLEYNADTPTSLYEAGIVQYFWSEEVRRGVDQFNSIHEQLVDYFRSVKPYLKPGKIYFACITDSLEDLTTVEYIRACALEAELVTEFIYINEIGWDSKTQTFVDNQEVDIQNIFKLYPWEWMVHEEFGQNLLIDRNHTLWIEPAWKMILSNKAILPILWQLFPNHPNLLPSYFEKPTEWNTYVAKPLLSREGANVEIVKNGNTILETAGEYGEEGFIFQEFFPLPEFEGNYAVIGSWVIGQEAAGIGIRENTTLVTNNTSRFIPHVIV